MHSPNSMSEFDAARSIAFLASRHCAFSTCKGIQYELHGGKHESEHTIMDLFEGAEDLVDLQPAVIEIHYQADISTAPLTGVAASVVGSDTSIRS